MKKPLVRLTAPFTVIGTLLAVAWPLSGLAVQAALLVSLGMPDAVLKAYLIQSRAAHIPLVIRGLYGAAPSTDSSQKNGKNSETGKKAKNSRSLGSFHATAKRLQQLMGDQSRGGVLIDPRLFRAFAIQAVPALVVYQTPLSGLKNTRVTNGVTQSSPDPSDYDVAMGNLPLATLLHRIATESASQERAAYAQQRALRLSSSRRSNDAAGHARAPEKTPLPDAQEKTRPASGVPS